MNWSLNKTNSNKRSLVEYVFPYNLANHSVVYIIWNDIEWTVHSLNYVFLKQSSFLTGHLELKMSFFSFHIWATRLRISILAERILVGNHIWHFSHVTFRDETVCVRGEYEYRLEIISDQAGNYPNVKPRFHDVACASEPASTCYDHLAATSLVCCVFPPKINAALPSWRACGNTTNTWKLRRHEGTEDFLRVLFYLALKLTNFHSWRWRKCGRLKPRFQCHPWLNKNDVTVRNDRRCGFGIKMKGTIWHYEVFTEVAQKVESVLRLWYF